MSDKSIITEAIDLYPPFNYFTSSGAADCNDCTNKVIKKLRSKIYFEVVYMFR